jgi:hypothetical protein
MSKEWEWLTAVTMRPAATDCERDVEWDLEKYQAKQRWLLYRWLERCLSRKQFSASMSNVLNRRTLPLGHPSLTALRAMGVAWPLV